MKTRLLAWVAVCVMVASTAAGASQPRQPDDKLGQILEIDGKLFLIHTVARGESLYGISKRYGVPLGEIARYNPDVYYGIKEGAKLRIPTTKPASAADGGAYTLHIVQEGETLYSLSRRYGVTVAQLRSYNGLTSDELARGVALRVPTGKPGVQPPTNEGKSGVWHTVRSGETLYMLERQYGSNIDSIKRWNNLTSDSLFAGQNVLVQKRGGVADADTCAARYVAQRGESLYSIAKRYGVSLNDLLRANPLVSQYGLRVNDELCIPKRVRQALAQQGEGKTEEAQTTYYPAAPSSPSVFCDSTNGYPAGRTLRCVLMLPFSLESVSSDSLQMPAAAKSGIPEGKAVRYDKRFLSFYQGALLALEQFKQSGYKIALNVLDTRSSERVRKIVESDTLEGADLIVGPVYAQNIALVSEYAASRRITMVSPLSGTMPTFEMNPFLFQASPSYRTQLRQLANSIELSDSTNVVLVREEENREEGAGQALHLMLEGRISSMPEGGDGVRYSVVDCSLADASATISRQIERHLLPERRNIVIVASNSEPMVSALLGQLAGVMRVMKYRVDVYGTPQWLKMNKLDFGHLVALNTHVLSPYYIDYEDQRVCGFVQRYREAYLSEPTQFAFQGYDIMVYFLRAIFKFGVDFRYCIDKVENWQLQNNFSFRQSRDFGTYESEGVFMLRFDRQRGLVRER